MRRFGKSINNDQIAFFVEVEKGNLITKSIEIESHFQVKALVHLLGVDVQLSPFDRLGNYPHIL